MYAEEDFLLWVGYNVWQRSYKGQGMPVLHWLTRDEDLQAAGRADYRLLVEDPALGGGDRDHAENMMIQGDNLEALKALLPFYAGQVKCIFIDPPYNTGSAFAHYDDNLEHTTWLSMMYPRLELLRELLAEEGSIWITLDDNECHYMKVVCDEVFGRANFVGNALWEKADSPRMDAQFFSVRHDHLLVYAKDMKKTLWNKLVTDGAPDHYDKKDTLGRRYYLKPLRAMGGQGDSRIARPTLYFPLIAPDESEVFPVRQDGTDGAWRWNKDKVEQEIDRIDWIQGRNGWTPYYRIYAEENQTRPPETIWSHGEVGSNRTSKAEIKKLFPDFVPFSTPKPEGLLERVIHIATNPGDLVLDSFLGSGTTAAVAHKMGRRYIGIEMGEHAKTHCVPRLKRVIEGEQGGISKSVQWTGGGGFRFYTLGETVFDDKGQIRETIKFDQLAAHLWFYETKTPFNKPRSQSPFLGIHGKIAYALLYNGILRDKRVNGGNVLTSKMLDIIRKDIGNAEYEKLVIYGESSRLGAARLKTLGIEFKQTPYDVRSK
ncbi:MAG: site-specific DNA-methyltransferase [Zoogloeaceae bacterium]|jgi:adenine-specific DNA-methyltransferase|nr:site-specific DNA-methyltransferase [Zoogloeaceae bacterium]